MFFHALYLSFGVTDVYAAQATPTWEETISKVSSSIVSIQVSSNRYFDTESTASSVATGFIVDAERGIILTNRHVVEPGPVTAQAILLNNEEITLRPIYRDPIHDFGFFAYDPKDIKFLQPQSLPLCVECAQVGLPVRLIGNDAGEKISILEATIARLDRNAPEYGKGRFNDFNTFYIQAAAGSSGGSSGSPVLNQKGQVVALNAGGNTRAASSFFLPLDRVQRALQLVQQGQPVTRGDLLATITSETFDRAKRLGLSEEEEKRFRKEFPTRDGVLILSQIVPAGPLYGFAKEGDILLRINGEQINHFVQLDAILDSNVDKDIVVEVQRAGEILEKKVTVTDLHRVTPDSLVMGCHATFNSLSYQMARHYGIPIDGVYISFPGYCFQKSQISANNVITAINDTPIHSIGDLWAVLQEIPDQQRFFVEYFALSNPQQRKSSAVLWDRTWFPLEQWTRNDTSGLWDITSAPAQKPSEPVFVGDVDLQEQVVVVDKKDKLIKNVVSSLVTVQFSIPLSIQGVYDDVFFGAGVILDAKEGIVAVDRDTVPIGLGDLEIVFAGSTRIPGRVVWIHPEHNIALVKYNPTLLGNTPLQSVEIDSDNIMHKDDTVWLYGLNYDYEIVGKKLKIVDTVELDLPVPRVPFFKDKNLEVGILDGVPPLVGGVVLNKKGKLIGQWASFPDLSSSDQERALFVLPSFVLAEALDMYRKQQDIRTLGVEFTTLNWIQAGELGFTTGVFAESVEKSEAPRTLFMVAKILPNTDSAKQLVYGDIILRVNGKPVYSIRELEEAYRQNSVALQILRQGTVSDITIETTSLSGQIDEPILSWGGALLHDVPWFVSFLSGIPQQGVYVSWCARGAPCSRDRLYPTYTITSVNQHPIHSVHELIEWLQTTEHTQDVRVETISAQGIPSTIVLRLDELYWQTQIIRHTEEWVLESLQPNNTP